MGRVLYASERSAESKIMIGHIQFIKRRIYSIMQRLFYDIIIFGI